MPAATQSHQLLRLMRHCKQAFPEPKRSRTVVSAVHDEERRGYASDALIGMKLIAHQQPNRHDRMNSGGDISGRREGRFHNELRDRMPCGKRNGNAGAEREAPEYVFLVEFRI